MGSYRKDQRHSRLRTLLERLKRLFWNEPDPGDDDPYSLVGAPKKPRPPQRRASVSAPLD